MANFDLSKLMEGKNPQQVMLRQENLEVNGNKLDFLKVQERTITDFCIVRKPTKQLLMNTQTVNKVQKNGVVALPLVRRIFGEIHQKEFVNSPNELTFSNYFLFRF